MDDSRLLQESNLTARQPHYAIQTTTSEVLAQGTYEVARVGFEPATLRIQGTEPTHNLPNEVKSGSN